MNDVIFRVSDLTTLTRQLLENHFPSIYVEGEISNFSMPPSGHWYFSLKDSNAHVRCLMFKSRIIRVKYLLIDCQHVLIKAKVSLYVLLS